MQTNAVTMKSLSVIVPVYRVEQYLAKCLDSILAQNVPDMEILVVDDGSPDDCYTIMQRYAQAYPEQVRIFQKPNGGLSDARNFGLSHAEGEYIAFVDSDDFLAEHMYATMLAKARQQDFDLVVCDLNYVFPGGRIQPASCNLSQDIFTEEEIKKSMISLYPAAWNKIYHRRLFEQDLRFQKGVWFEDVEFLYRLFPHLHSIGVVNQPFYQYVQRDGAITATFDHRLFDYLKNWETILAFYHQNGQFGKYQAELQYSCMRYLYATFLKGVARGHDFSVFQDAYRQARTFVHQHFSRAWRNPYFYRTGAKGIYLLTFQRLSAWLLYLWIQRK